GGLVGTDDLRRLSHTFQYRRDFSDALPSQRRARRYLRSRPSLSRPQKTKLNAIGGPVAKSHYEPPKQSAIGQLIDSLFLLVLVIAALFAPLYLKLAGGGKVDLPLADKSTWVGLGQNAVQQAQWEKLGFTPDTAAPLIVSRFDYSFNVTELAITAIV